MLITMKIVISLGIVAAIVAAGVFYQLFFYIPQNAETLSDENLRVNETTQANTDGGTFSGKGTLQALLDRNQSLECTVAYKPSEYEDEITGSYFVAEGKVRGDFVTPAPGFENGISTSVIFTNDTAYIWSEINGQSYGTKTVITEDTEVDDTPVPTDVSVSYTCKPWLNVDGSIFEPPGRVLFKDTAELFETGMEYGTVYEEGEF